MSLILYQEALTANSFVPASAFITTYIPVNNVASLYVGGAFQIPTVDFSVSGTNIFTTSLIASGVSIWTVYQYNSALEQIETYIDNTVRRYEGTTLTREVLSANLTMSASAFTVAYTPIDGSIDFYLDGLLQAPTFYTVSGNNIFTTTMITSAQTAVARYYYAVTNTLTNILYDGYRILPDGIIGSTTFNNVIKTYANLKDRVLRTLGWPVIDIEICDENIYDNINQAIEWYSKYAGMTEEFLIFSSDLYREPGLRIDTLFSITPTMRQTLSNGTSACWDYDLNDYRKVIGVFEFNPGESTGINSLFTLEQTMAQQTYFSYMLGNVGFDLVTWHILKDWLDMRTKVLAQTPYVDFDPRKQLLRIIPSPNRDSRFYGVVGCWVERTIRELVQERWVYQYTLALTKITVGNIRGKYGSVQMFGGGTINYNDLLSQGLQEKKQLEEELMNGFGEVTPPRFFVG